MVRMLAELLRWKPKPAAPAGARWSAWARALAARHARADAQTRAAAMALVTRGGAAPRWSWATLALRPRLELARSRGVPAREAAPARARAGRARFAPAGALAPTRAPARLAPPPPWSAAPFVLAGPPPSARAHERTAGLTLERSRLIVQRLVEGRARREDPRAVPTPRRRDVQAAVPAAAVAPPWAAAASSRSGTPRLAPGAGPPAMVLAAPAAAPDSAPDAALATLAAREHPQAARAAAAPAVQAPIDISALTDQVVRQLDRRIVAHRERMGRI